MLRKVCAVGLVALLFTSMAWAGVAEDIEAIKSGVASTETIDRLILCATGGAELDLNDPTTKALISKMLLHYIRAQRAAAIDAAKDVYAATQANAVDAAAGQRYEPARDTTGYAVYNQEYNTEKAKLAAGE